MDFLDEQLLKGFAGRGKKPETAIKELEEKAKSICDEFSEFTKGVRVIQLILRKADGGGANNDKVKKYISTNPDEFYQCLLQCLKYNALSDKNFRIYSSVNERDMDKAIRQFKQCQLDSDYDSPEIRDRFYTDVRNRWISAMMKPSSKKTSYFLLDIDTTDAGEARGKVAELGLNVYANYATKNGWHMVVDPFNPQLMDGVEETTVQKDSLLLLHY